MTMPKPKPKETQTPKVKVEETAKDSKQWNRNGNGKRRGTKATIPVISLERKQKVMERQLRMVLLRVLATTVESEDIGHLHVRIRISLRVMGRRMAVNVSGREV